MKPYVDSIPARDPALWRLAERRAKFKAHLFNYLLVNVLLWVVWALTGRAARPLPWPVFVSAFWGLNLLLHGLGVYGLLGRGDLAEREYERLLRQH
jgi:hypothetical protein